MAYGATFGNQNNILLPELPLLPPMFVAIQAGNPEHRGQTMQALPLTIPPGCPINAPKVKYKQ